MAYLFLALLGGLEQVGYMLRSFHIPVEAFPVEFVVEQILSNAIKYSGENRAVTIQINRNEADNTCELVISDQGIGIRKEDLPRIFEKGYTGYNGRADKTSTGIGLYLCREITKKLGHGIMITSEIGKGTDVTIVFERNNLDVRD